MIVIQDATCICSHCMSIWLFSASVCVITSVVFHGTDVNLTGTLYYALGVLKMGKF